jgi:cytidine deaminase
MILDEAKYKVLSAVAWEARSKARLYGPTAVGCSVLDSSGRVFGGCNLEHRFRSHDVHAEVNAISSLVAGGGSDLEVVLIAAERERFTPCGACLDWIFEIGGGDCLVISEPVPGAPAHRHLASELAPHYPF